MAQAQLETTQNRNAEMGVQGEAPGAGEFTPEKALAVARQSFDASTDVYSELSRQWERNLRAFNNRHPNGSKYDSDEYKHRSRIFRPKTRSSIRKNEAQCAAAFFSNADVVDVQPQDDDDDMQRASADLYKEVLQHRLTKTIPWFLVLMGAFQVAKVQGVTVSKQYWRYEEREVGRRDVFQRNADGVFEQTTEPVIEKVKDEPIVELVPPENLRIHKGASWVDPINTSPFLIDQQPWFVVDVKARIASRDPKTGQPAWKEVTDAQILQAVQAQADPTRQAREGEGRRDSKESGHAPREHDIVWIHENVIRWEGQDWHFFSLGTIALLTEPKPLREVYFHADKQRPYVMGYANLEAHKAFPSGMPQLVEGLQQAANEIENLRFDNVKLAMNGRVKVKVGRNINYETVRRHIPGGVIPVTAEDDVTWDRPPDVTASAYAEQDRINVDFDELAGSFSTGSVSSNRQLNETVGGMNLLSANANLMGDYDLRVFVETWVEPVLRQLILLEQRYETDEVILALAGRKANLVQKYGIDAITDELLDQELTVTVNVGIGATDPERKLQRFMVAQKASIELIAMLYGPQAPQMVRVDQHISEIFGLSGYKDGTRFFDLGDDGDPRIAALQAQLEEAMAALEGRDAELQNKVEVAQITTEGEIQERTIAEQGAMAREVLKGRNQLALKAIDARAAAAQGAMAGRQQLALTHMKGQQAERQTQAKGRQQFGLAAMKGGQAERMAQQKSQQEARA